MQFINTTHGHIPISRVISIDVGRVEYDEAGTVAVTHLKHDETFYELDIGQAVPAYPGFFVCGLYSDGGYYKVPVVAWLVNGEEARPVVPDHITWQVILYPDGTAHEPAMADYESIDDWLKSLQKENSG